MSVLPCIDIGVNLTHRSFRQDLTDVIYRARDVGVSTMIVTGTCLRSSQEAADLSLNFPGTLYATAGVHPHNANQFTEETLTALRAVSVERHVVAIGECGLDYVRDFSPRDAQHRCFEAQLSLAAEVQLPVFLHDRGAFDDFLPTVKRYRDRLRNGVVHCFTGTRSQAFAYLDLGLYLGMTGWLCDPHRGGPLRELVAQLPADRLMIETDAPFLAPKDLVPKVKRNEPRFLPHVLQALSDCRQEPVAPLAQRILTTTRQFFQIDSRC